MTTHELTTEEMREYTYQLQAQLEEALVVIDQLRKENAEQRRAIRVARGG